MCQFLLMQFISWILGFVQFDTAGAKVHDGQQQIRGFSQCTAIHLHLLIVDSFLIDMSVMDANLAVPLNNMVT